MSEGMKALVETKMGYELIKKKFKKNLHWPWTPDTIGGIDGFCLSCWLMPDGTALFLNGTSHGKMEHDIYKAVGMDFYNDPKHYKPLFQFERWLPITIQNEFIGSVGLNHFDGDDLKGDQVIIMRKLVVMAYRLGIIQRDRRIARYADEYGLDEWDREKLGLGKEDK